MEKSRLPKFPLGKFYDHQASSEVLPPDTYVDSMQISLILGGGGRKNFKSRVRGGEKRRPDVVGKNMPIFRSGEENRMLGAATFGCFA